MSFEEWVSSKDIYEALGDLNSVEIAKRINNELALGIYLREQLFEFYRESHDFETDPDPYAVSSDLKDDVRYINERL